MLLHVTCVAEFVGLSLTWSQTAKPFITASMVLETQKAL